MTIQDPGDSVVRQPAEELEFGAGGVLWWNAREPRQKPPGVFRADEHAVELVLFGAGRGTRAAHCSCPVW